MLKHSIERNGQHSLGLDAIFQEIAISCNLLRYLRPNMTCSYSLSQRKVDQNEIDHTHARPKRKLPKTGPASAGGRR